MPSGTRICHRRPNRSISIQRHAPLAIACMTSRLTTAAVQFIGPVSSTRPTTSRPPGMNWLACGSTRWDGPIPLVLASPSRAKSST